MPCRPSPSCCPATISERPARWSPRHCSAETVAARNAKGLKMSSELMSSCFVRTHPERHCELKRCQQQRSSSFLIVSAICDEQCILAHYANAHMVT